MGFDGSILFLPGRGDAYEKYLETLGQWREAGWQVTAADWRGQAGSGRLGADAVTGHVGDFTDAVFRNRRDDRRHVTDQTGDLRFAGALSFAENQSQEAQDACSNQKSAEHSQRCADPRTFRGWDLRKDHTQSSKRSHK